jgi:hypothetical protein
MVDWIANLERHIVTSKTSEFSADPSRPGRSEVGEDVPTFSEACGVLRQDDVIMLGEMRPRHHLLRSAPPEPGISSGDSAHHRQRHRW